MEAGDAGGGEWRGGTAGAVGGEFPWQAHDEDEMFLCWSGSFRIEMVGRTAVTWEQGELFVVPAGVRHRPAADVLAYRLLFEREETAQHGRG